MLYNPETMQNPGITLSRVREVDEGMKIVRMRMRMHEPYAKREDALNEDTSRVVLFYENGVLYEALRTASWEWKPCTGVECESGINWDTYYAPSEKLLREYLEEHFTHIDWVAPRLLDNGLYAIQVHYDGRCR